MTCSKTNKKKCDADRNRSPYGMHGKSSITTNFAVMVMDMDGSVVLFISLSPTTSHCKLWMITSAITEI